MLAKNLISLTRRVVLSQNKPLIASFGTFKGDEANILYARQPGDTGGKHHDHAGHTPNNKEGKGQINQEHQFPGTSKGKGQGSGDIFRDPEAAKKHVQDDLYDRGGTTEQAPIVDDPNARKKQDPIKEDTKEKNDKDKFAFDENAESQRLVKMAILRSNIASTYALATLLRAQNLIHPFNYDDSLGKVLSKTEDILRDLQERVLGLQAVFSGKQPQQMSPTF